MKLISETKFCVHNFSEVRHAEYFKSIKIMNDCLKYFDFKFIIYYENGIRVNVY